MTSCLKITDKTIFYFLFERLNCSPNSTRGWTTHECTYALYCITHPKIVSDCSSIRRPSQSRSLNDNINELTQKLLELDFTKLPQLLITCPTMMNVGFLNFSHKTVFQDSYWVDPRRTWNPISAPLQVSSITVPLKGIDSPGSAGVVTFGRCQRFLFDDQKHYLFSVLSEPGWSQFWPPATVPGLVGSMDLLASTRVHTRRWLASYLHPVPFDPFDTHI
jgi:hypothetical protein